MASTTPTRRARPSKAWRFILTDLRLGDPPSYRQRTRSKSPRSRPTTPLRPSSRSSLRDSVQRGRGAASSGNALEGLQDGFAELSDAMADLEQNFMQLQLMHESLARFSESFAGFLYGMNMNAFCVDFPEVGNVTSHCRRALAGVA
jgi:DASH complex subunit DAM1